ncbi:unnamed protein product [Boreogadus saida]
MLKSRLPRSLLPLSKGNRTKTEQLGVEEFLPEKDELKHNIRAYLLSYKGLRGSAAPVVLCEAGGGREAGAQTDRLKDRQFGGRQFHLCFKCPQSISASLRRECQLHRLNIFFIIRWLFGSLILYIKLSFKN